MINDNIEYEINTNHYPVRYKRESFVSVDNDSYLYTTKGGSHLKKLSGKWDPDVQLKNS